MKYEAIILVGGLGTRLQAVVADQPKCLAPINERAFLLYLIKYLTAQHITKIILSLGYKSDMVIAFIDKEIRPNFTSLQIECVVEKEALGTGGAIAFALRKATQDNVFIFNGDTFYDIPLHDFFNQHVAKKSLCSLALKPMQHFDRYGVVEIDDANIISQFKEKQAYEVGVINGGIYLLNKKHFLEQSFPKIFSFEKTYLENIISQNNVYGFVHDNYFIDIGVPEDYAKAQKDFATIFKNK